MGHSLAISLAPVRPAAQKRLAPLAAFAPSSRAVRDPAGPLARRLRWLLVPLVLAADGGQGSLWAHADLEALERVSGEEVDHHPEDPEVYLRQARVQRAAGDWDAALLALQRAAEHGADADVVGAARGQVYLDAGWPHMARFELDRVLARRPDAFAALFDRGRAWMMLGEPEQAARDFARAVEGLPQPRPEQVFAWRDALVAAGRREEAVRALDVGIARLGPAVSLRLAALELAVELERYDDALGRLEQMLADQPDNAAWVARRGEVLEKAGRPSQARAEYARALELLERRSRERRGERSAELERRLRLAVAAGGPPPDGKPLEGTP